MKIMLQKEFLWLFLLCFTSIIAQGQNEKVIFIKEPNTTLQANTTYEFTIGYVALTDSDLSVELSGGPSKFYAGSKVKVKKGQGIKKLTITTNKKPTKGKGYKLVLSLRDVNGNWKTTRTGQVISNIEMVKQAVSFSNNVTFSPLLATNISSNSKYNVPVSYITKEPIFIQAAIWEGGKWLASSDRIKVMPGQGEKQLQINYEQALEGKNYKYSISFGDKEDFDSKSYVTKEISGVQITKAANRLSIAEINDKSIQVSVNNTSDILILPSATNYDYIKIITLKGKTVSESKNSKSINIKNLPNGGYFAITSTNEYYKFAKF
ncbi:hypothetical protein AX016_1750 [Cellulophaga sp. RHA19]|uniref:hypothetical protein n=1 Tax=Cellulophaga sp. RHA19 TaxID=1798237 RepID=UPI000C2BAED0|nr:hypothetical protein [Cellulophaga sp. RHA19]PKB43549.1 hypothetical protein AX016_1750 [Cellulophaga sp. RHA19]